MITAKEAKENADKHILLNKYMAKIDEAIKNDSLNGLYETSIVIEDEEFDASALKKYLMSLGYHVAIELRYAYEAQNHYIVYINW